MFKNVVIIVLQNILHLEIYQNNIYIYIIFFKIYFLYHNIKMIKN
jgi:hypothetical protein